MNKNNDNINNNKQIIASFGKSKWIYYTNINYVNIKLRCNLNKYG